MHCWAAAVRDMLVFSLASWVGGAVVAIVFSPQILSWLKSPAAAERELLQGLDLTSGFSTMMSIALWGGIAIAFPLVSYAVLRFVSPALTKREKVVLLTILVIGTMFFISGVWLAYRETLPVMLKVFKQINEWIGMQSEVYFASDYMPVILKTLFAFGLIFQVPLIIFVLGWFGVEPIKWLGPDLKFGAMLGAIIFGVVGYYMMVFIGGIERIPEDVMEAATLDGANAWQKLTKITMPLLKGTTRTIMTFWTIVAVQSFVWTKVFSPISTESSTIVPISYMYEILFGSLQSPEVDIGTGAAVGVLVAVIIMVITSVINRLFKTDDLEL